AGLEGPALVALDSRRADFYVQLFGPDSTAEAVLPDDLGTWVTARVGAAALAVAGDAADAAAKALSGRAQITVLPGTAPDARGVLAAARDIAVRGGNGGDPRPLYIRPPDVTFPAPAAPRPARR